MKVKRFCTAKGIVTRPKRQSTEWEKTFASYKSDKGLITRICRKLQKLNPQNINDPMKKWADELNRAFSKEVQMAKKYMNKCSTSLAIKEMKIKTTLRFHLTLVRMAIIKNTSVGEDAGKEESFYTVDGNVD
jgi:hypothetical protein